MNSQRSLQFTMRRSPNLMGDPKKLKEDINILSKNIRKLTENKVFFEALLEEKLKKFIKILKSDLKDSKNTEIVKKCLSLIHKHSEYDPTQSKRGASKPQADPGKGDFSRSVTSALKKIEEEVRLNEEKFKRETSDNAELLRELLMSMNNKETLQVEPRKVGKITQRQVERKCEELKNKLANMEAKNRNLKGILDNEIYQLTLEHEKRGRDIMQEKVIELAVKSVQEGHEEPRTVQKAKTVDRLFKTVKFKAGQIDKSEYDSLMKRKKELEKRISMSKQILKI